MTQPLLKTVALLAAVFLSGCTMKGEETPPLSGPSEYGTSIAITISPDVLTQDGASQSLVTITAFDSEGRKKRNQSLRAEIKVEGIPVDFGSLSARNLVTGDDGSARLVYTAPATAPGPAVDQGTMIEIVITPVGTDFNNSSSRTAAIRLVPPGFVVPPDGLRPNFTFTPTAPTDNQTVLFDATTSTSGAGNSIARYTWNFGDGGTASGPTAGHAYANAGFYVVTLTISDALGRSAQKTSSIQVGAGLEPTATFTASPGDAQVGQPVSFNASGTRAAPGLSIVSYEWSFGDGATAQGQTVSHAYASPGSYTATLNVTDSAGREGTSTQSVTVGGSTTPTAAFAFSPAAPMVNQTVNFNATSSRPSGGSTIASYLWNFGDGTTGQGQTTTHAYRATGTYSVTLTISDSAGRSTTATQTVPVVGGAAAAAAFTYAPPVPLAYQPVTVNASPSQPSPGASIASYAWTFGDGTVGQGQSASHIYVAAGTYIITLTVTDTAGSVATTSQAVTVSGVTADFTFSPIDPAAGANVNFNASGSRPAPGQTIATYAWSFGDGTNGTGVIPAPHRYAAPGTYLVVLTITDTAGNVATRSQPVTVK